MIEWLIDLLVDWLIDLLINQPFFIDWLINLLVDRLIDQPFFIDWLSTYRLIDWLINLLIDWLIDQPIDWLIDLVLTHPMTIGKVVANYTPKRKKDSPKSVHLVGTDTPEVTFNMFFINILIYKIPESLRGNYAKYTFKFYVILIWVFDKNFLSAKKAKWSLIHKVKLKTK